MRWLLVSPPAHCYRCLHRAHYNDTFGIDERPSKSLYQLDGGSLVLYLSTVAKVLAPGLRLGWIIASEYMIEQLALIKERTNLFTESLGQLVLAEFIRSGGYDRHLQRMRKEHRARCDALFAAMQRHLPARAIMGARPNGGIYFWGRLTGGLKASELLDRAIRAGVAFATGEIFSYQDEAGSENVRLCFANLQPEQIEEGMKRLGKCFAQPPPIRHLACKKLPLV